MTSISAHRMKIRNQTSNKSKNINIFDSNNDEKINNISKKLKTNVIKQNNEIDVKNQKQNIKSNYDSFKKNLTKSKFDVFIKKIRI